MSLLPALEVIRTTAPVTNAPDGAGIINRNFAVISDRFVERTPENSGFTVTRDGTGDNTAALNDFFTLCAASGDPACLNPGQYRTTAEVVFPTSAVRGASLRGLHARRVQIKPAAATYNGLRIQGNGFSPENYGVNVSNISVIGPSNTPTKNGFAAIVLDKAPQAILRDCFASAYDVGLDFVNNCFNSSIYGFRTARNLATLNCAVNIRDGNDSGSDLNFYDMQAIGINVAVCIQGGGGGYRFYGGSLASWGTVNADDKYGAVTMGWDYVADAASGAPDGVYLSGFHMEGVTNRYHFRTYGPCAFEVANSSFYPSNPTSGQQCKGILLATDAQNLSDTWTHNQLGQNSIFASSELVNISGQNADRQSFESGWVSPACTLGGVSKSRGWMKSIWEFSNQSGSLQRGVYTGIDGGTGFGFLGLGQSRLRINHSRNTLEQSDDSGANWLRAGKQQQITSSSTSFTPASGDTDVEYHMTAGTAVTWNLPAFASVALRSRSRFRIYQDGAGTVTVTPAGGVTLLNPFASAATLSQYGFIEIEHTGTLNTWRVVNRTAAT